MKVPRYTDSLTGTLYDALCRALYLQQRCATPQRAIELELRFGQLCFPSSPSSRTPLNVPVLTPAVLLPSEHKAHRFDASIPPAVMSHVEAAVQNLGQMHARQTHTALSATSLTRPPLTEVVVHDEEQQTLLVYASGHRGPLVEPSSGTSPRVFSFVKAERKYAVDALDITCMTWMCDVRLAIASEETVEPFPMRGSSSSLSITRDEQVDDAITPTRITSRLKQSVRVHPYVECHVVHEKLLVTHRTEMSWRTYTCGLQLKPTPLPWHQLAARPYMRVEMELDMKAIQRDWSRLSGAKATRAVLGHYGSTAAPEKRAEHTAATAPLDPFLKSVVGDVLALTQFMLRPESST